MQNFMSDGSNIFVSLGVKESRKTSGPGCSKGGGHTVSKCQSEGTHQIVMSFLPPVVACLLL